MIRDPIKKRADGNPECFGAYLEGHFTCENKCVKVHSCRSITGEDDKRREGKQFRGQNGIPLCFGELYSPLSDECQETCEDAHDCQTATDDNDRARRINATTPTGIRSDRLHMYREIPRQPQPQPQVATYQSQYVDERTQQYIKQKYGVGLKADPTIIGQFEGEPWYERFFKEVAKNSAYHALQLLAYAVSTVRWAPSTEDHGQR